MTPGRWAFTHSDEVRFSDLDVLGHLNNVAFLVFVESAREALLPMYEVIPLQLFAYFMAINNGIDVDHPRNLTKAVLAE